MYELSTVFNRIVAVTSAEDYFQERSRLMTVLENDRLPIMIRTQRCHLLKIAMFTYLFVKKTKKMRSLMSFLKKDSLITFKNSKFAQKANSRKMVKLNINKIVFSYVGNTKFWLDEFSWKRSRYNF